MRAFLAFEVSEAVTAKLLQAGLDIRRTGADASIVGRENLHFTVKFLGDVPDGVAAEVDSRIKRLDLRGIEARVRGVGAFPDLRRPRIVWAGVAQEDEKAFDDMSKRIIDALDGVGKPADHDFHAHITLARVRSPRNIDALVSFIKQQASLDFGATPISSLKLKSSVLTPTGPIYSDVREYALR